MATLYHVAMDSLPSADRLTLIIPVHNEDENIHELCVRVQELEQQLSSRNYSLHVLFLDNASSDDSWIQIESELPKFLQATAIRFTRNYGFQNSIAYGVSMVKDGCAVVLQSDLQDPPELVLKLVDLWRKGALTVGAQPVKRSENSMMNLVRRLFYLILSLLSGSGETTGIQDFYLLDAKVCMEIVAAKPQKQLLRTYISENFGFQCLVTYERSPRNAGTPSLNIVDYYDLALDGFLLSGSRGIRFLTIGSFIVAALSFCASIALVFAYIAGWRPPIGGWLSLMVIFTTFSSLMLAAMGLSLEFLQRLLKTRIGLLPTLESDRISNEHL
jgi:glycosyltransferase involved in cell wall biosynthesis